MLRTILAAVAAIAFAALPAAAHSVKLGELSITDLWTRATPPNAPTAGGYLTVTNAGKDADTLLAAASPLAAKGELHQMAMKDGVMTMRAVPEGIPVPAGGSVALDPDGYHIMFVGLKGSLKEGDKLPVTLTFAKAGKIDTTLHVLALGAKGPSGMAGMKMVTMGGMKMDAGQ